MGRPIRRARIAICRSWSGQGKASLTETLKESPGSGGVDKPPLHDLSAAQRGPDVRDTSVWCPVVHFLNSQPSMLVIVQMYTRGVAN